MKTKIFQLHKRSSYVFADIQDKFAVDIDKGIIAIADGATQGFKSEVWAEQLVNSFVKNPVFQVNSLLNGFKIEAHNFSKIDFPFSENLAIKALENRKKDLGSFATFLGIKVSENQLDFISSGDVCGFIELENEILSFPFDSVKELDNDKGFLGTVKIINDELSAEQFRTGSLPLKNDSKIFLMTDAFARMVLRDTPKLSELFTIDSYDKFYNYILSKWESKGLEEDDITLVIVENNKNSTVQKFLPPNNFSFPKEEKPTYIELPNPIVRERELTEKEMKEIQEQLNQLNAKIEQVNHQNHYLQKQVKFFKIVSLLAFLMTLGALFIAGFLMSEHYFNTQKEDKGNQVKVSETSVKNKPIKESVIPTISTKPENNVVSESAKKAEPTKTIGSQLDSDDKQKKTNPASAKPITKNKFESTPKVIQIQKNKIDNPKKDSIKK
jgi:hypothetical protein